MRWFAGWVFGVVVLGFAGRLFGEEPKSGPPATLNELSMEVSALQILHHLNVTAPQLTALRKIAKGAVPNSQDVKPGKGSEKLRAAQWKGLRADFGDEVSLLEARADTEKAEKVSDEVIQLLIVARSLPDAD